MALSKAAKEVRNAYQREWYRKNRDKARKNKEAYWEKRAAEAAQAEQGEQEK